MEGHDCSQPFQRSHALTYVCRSRVRQGAGRPRIIKHRCSAAGKSSVEANERRCYGGVKAYGPWPSVFRYKHETHQQAIRVQVVLPPIGTANRTAWDVAASPWQKMPPEIVMPVKDMVGRSAGRSRSGRKTGTIPPLHNWRRGDTFLRPSPRYVAKQFALRPRGPLQGKATAEGQHNWREMCVAGNKQRGGFFACLMRL